MFRRIEPDAYYDEPYGPGTHCVMLAMADDLVITAIPAFKHVAELKPGFSFWVCGIVTPDDAATVQAVRFPQYRFIRDGSERHCHVGVLDHEELVAAFDHMEDS